MPKIVHCGLDYSGGGGGSGEANFIELSQGEYNALSYDEKHDPNKMYLITDGPEAEAQYFDPIVYSTYEREVGVWIDGKPLYQITVTGKFSGTSFRYNTSISTMEVKHFYVTYTKTDAGDSEYKYVIDDPDYFKIRTIQAGEVQLTKNSASAYGSSNTVFVTIQYTKSSDTPGSGNYASNGVPAVHFTTDEQVIGTWLDGKPLYQKTIVHDTAMTHRSWTTIISDSTISIKRYEGYLFLDGNRFSSTDYHRGADQNEYCCTALNNSASRLDVYPSIGASYTVTCEVTIQYTKTTD